MTATPVSHSFTRVVKRVSYCCTDLRAALRTCARWATRLQSFGYTVMGINLPGHATTEDDMGQHGSREWLQAALDAQAFYAASYKKGRNVRPFYGCNLYRCWSPSRGKPDACISISAPLPQRNRLLPLTGVFGFILPRVAWKTDPNRKNTNRSDI